MDQSERLESVSTDSLVDFQVPLSGSGVPRHVEAADEPLEDGSFVRSGFGRQQGAGTRQTEPSQGITGVDAHSELRAEYGQVADVAGPLVGSIPGSAEACTALSVRNPVPAAMASSALFQ